MPEIGGVILEYQPEFLGLCAPQGSILCGSAENVHVEAKVCSPEVQAVSSLLAHCPEGVKLHHLVVTAAKAALEHYIPHQLLPVGEQKVQHGTLLAPQSLV